MDANRLQQFLARLQDENPTVRRATALLLGREKPEGVVGALAKSLRDPVWQVRHAAATALGQIGEERAFDPLLQRLGAKESNARAAVLETLSRAPSAEAESTKTGKSAHAAGGPSRGDVEDNAETRRAIALAIARIRPDLVEEPLCQALNVDAPSVKIAAMSGLASLGAPEAAEWILPLCDHPELQVSKAAVVALGILRATVAAPKLMELCQSPHAALRCEAVIALNHLKVEEAYVTLVGRLKDPDIKVRAAAALAVGNTRRAEAVEALLPLLEDESADVRAAACQALVTLKAVGHADALAPLLLDETTEVRNAAALSYYRLVG
ncbi:MAG: HEAT repeat domain-containing protein [Candidatus Sumerlaeota bacterium]|nr:HEAT repeat domain-containing protein [Candidatus Sumerlaeota bacterium]